MSYNDTESLRHIWLSGIENAVGNWHNHRIFLLLSGFTLLIILKLLFKLQQLRLNSINPKILPKNLPNTSPLKKETHNERKSAGAKGPRRIIGEIKRRKLLQEQDIRSGSVQILVFYSSLTGTTEQTAKLFTCDLTQTCRNLGAPNYATFHEPKLVDLSAIDFDEYFLNIPKDGADCQYFYLLILPTYNIDTILDGFIEHLRETHHDFRINTSPLSGLLGYSVFGFGDVEGWPTEKDGFCSQARDTDKWMAKLTGGKRAFPLGMGDIKKDGYARLDDWKKGVEDVLSYMVKTGNLGEGVLGSGDAVESDEDTDEDQILDQRNPTQNRLLVQPSSTLNDLEDINVKPASDKTSLSLQEIDFTTKGNKPNSMIKEMVPKNSPTYAALTKQGYSIIGSHSGVKICRWTKSALRGRGSCYKYSFYGIASHQCMETTPSLSCSNKCVFCWRHGTNPVGTTWRWTVDPPELIFDGAKAGHYQKIKMMRGVPGVRAERFTEALSIRHCALSLVGEPIFYPHINKFLALLHAERISSFLVCNAQHPDQLAALGTVTQLYVSIDASNRESLRKIDRPLHRDFWERFNRCLDILRERRFEQRTVFRLTLVKGFNIEDEVMGYADLVEKSLPCFIEVKGVTYCGTSASVGAALTMQNVPFYEEVCTFVKALDLELRNRKLGYGIAAEHAHSCCILIASERFKVGGKWHTRIDYEKFFQCLNRRQPFRPEDYMGPETPDWATWGRGGFDPRDERVYRKGKNKGLRPEIQVAPMEN
ncbi:Bgt-4633 [Blumeria graminis f. sp. tritici]|uniref:S-adenosyl-L-methionine-dependent tRNA 4-demethylwyosine synthase n=2 Tax=Blumeria graminis f. sp. tritici TaxID=62690 RepID=A0A061HDC1_BLUGR|nr:hypothetical protein BGT96224_4633 [Blumeria graminis f. sp. tritici 96224]VDB92835.1 Bgt-4633 [Blumeria graminis f. sp. tritici]